MAKAAFVVNKGDDRSDARSRATNLPRLIVLALTVMTMFAGVALLLMVRQPQSGGSYVTTFSNWMRHHMSQLSAPQEEDADSIKGLLSWLNAETASKQDGSEGELTVFDPDADAPIFGDENNAVAAPVGAANAPRAAAPAVDGHDHAGQSHDHAKTHAGEKQHEGHAAAEDDLQLKRPAQGAPRLRAPPSLQLTSLLDASNSNTTAGRQGRGAGSKAASNPHERLGELLRAAMASTKLHPQIEADLAPFAALYNGSGGRGRLSLNTLKTLYVTDRSQSQRLYLMTILNGALFMDGLSWGKNAEWTPKARDWLAQIHSVLHAVREAQLAIPDVSFLVQFGSMPFSKLDGPDASVPVFSMAKSDEYSDLLYPNPYFGPVDDWDSFSGKLLQASKKRSWKSRDRKAFWRGSCVQWPGSRPRVELVNLHQDKRFDVAFTVHCPVKTWPALSSKPDVDATIKAEIGALRVSQRVNAADFSKHKYLVHMPGSTQGSYSRNMQIVLGLGGVVLLWDSPFYEFYYKSLTQGVHYVRVNVSTIVDTVQGLIADDTRAEAIAAAGNEWYRGNLRGVNLATYWVQLLTQYSKLLDFKPSLSYLKNPCTCNATILGGRSGAWMLVPIAHGSYDGAQGNPLPVAAAARRLDAVAVPAENGTTATGEGGSGGSSPDYMRVNIRRCNLC